MENQEPKEIKVKVKKSIVLNTNDVLYHDVMTLHDAPRYFVYTLGNNKTDANYYELWPTVRMATFENKQDADMYHDAINNIMAYQKNQMVYQKIREWVDEDITNFRKSMMAMGKTIIR